MYISLCLWHLIKVPNTNPKSVSTSKFIGLSSLPLYRLTYFRDTQFKKNSKSKPKHASRSKQ